MLDGQRRRVVMAEASSHALQPRAFAWYELGSAQQRIHIRVGKGRAQNPIKLELRSRMSLGERGLQLAQFRWREHCSSPGLLSQPFTPPRLERFHQFPEPAVALLGQSPVNGLPLFGANEFYSAANDIAASVPPPFFRLCLVPTLHLSVEHGNELGTNGDPDLILLPEFPALALVLGPHRSPLGNLISFHLLRHGGDIARPADRTSQKARRWRLVFAARRIFSFIPTKRLTSSLAGYLYKSGIGPSLCTKGATALPPLRSSFSCFRPSIAWR
jgi:hypothetical protein